MLRPFEWAWMALKAGLNSAVSGDSNQDIFRSRSRAELCRMETICMASTDAEIRTWIGWEWGIPFKKHALAGS